MDTTFILCPNIIGVLGLSILLILTDSNFYLEKKKLNMFRAVAAVNIAIIVMEVVDYILGGTPFESAYIFRRITTATSFALSPIYPLLLAYISDKSKFSKWICVPAALNVVMSYCSIFTGHMFLIDSWNSYFRGPLFYVMLAISLFYLAILICISFENLKGGCTGETGFLISIVAVTIIGNLLEIILSFHFLLWNSCAVMLICYYLYLHIQYFKHDPLTNTFNRNVFLVALKSIKQTDNLGIVSFDLDNLKRINDFEGHERGDEYIVSSTKIIEQCFSSVGYLYRVGGDEFVVLAPNTTEKKIRENVERFNDECQKEKVSVSCGYSFSPSAADLSQMLRDADIAMYENKRQRKLNR